MIQDGMRTVFGDANLDGQFNSADQVVIFQRGAYEDDLALNSGWADGDWDGDWDGDGGFGSEDLVLAFQRGGYTVIRSCRLESSMPSKFARFDTARFRDHKEGKILAALLLATTKKHECHYKPNHNADATSN